MTDLLAAVAKLLYDYNMASREPIISPVFEHSDPANGRWLVCSWVLGVSQRRMGRET